MSEQHRDEFVLSYHRVRMALGVLGIMLPFVLLLGGLLDRPRIEPSISDFYYTTYRDIFVGTMCAIGVFLISYRGYRREPGDWLNDDWLATIAGLAAFGVALFPNESKTHRVDTMTQQVVGIDVSPLFHYASALILFTCLAGFCLIKFSRTAKPARRWIYRSCGWVIVASLVGIAVASYFKLKGGPGAQDFVVAYNVVFWFEAIGIWAFGVSWLVKGKADLMLTESLRRAVKKPV